ncbi:MAG: aminoacyl-tRNA hydrolase [Candidatus Omnitrophica bacterium]|jgi:PTH1 family peptidyl-tRNA hydrolase|nr:aminoacyl-tRNA hydrolase [Candidatus Omnitrophota bacterium]
MKLIVGLGNPGGAYLHSRHNIGFMVVKALAKAEGLALKKDNSASALSAKLKIDNQAVVLAIPLTFMNLSGIAVRQLAKKYKAGHQDILIVCDDLDLAFGKLKIRKEGSSGGQRGLESIIDFLGGKDFSRLRIGISRPQRSSDAAEYVLSAFTKQEREELKEIISKALDCCLSWVCSGIDESMNIFNQRSCREEK